MSKEEASNTDETQVVEQVIAEEPVVRSGPSTKFTALIMTLFPLSIANWLIFGVLYFFLAYVLIPYKLDMYTGEMVPDWKASLPFTLMLYFPISFAFHFVTKNKL